MYNNSIRSVSTLRNTLVLWFSSEYPCARSIQSLAFAGAWVAEEGKGYGKLAFSQYSADDFYGERSDLEEFNGSEFSYYGEYGIGNKLAMSTLAYVTSGMQSPSYCPPLCLPSFHTCTTKTTPLH